MLPDTKARAGRLVRDMLAAPQASIAGGGLSATGLFGEPVKVPPTVRVTDLGVLVEIGDGQGSQGVVYRTEYHGFLFKRYKTLTGMNPHALATAVSWRNGLGGIEQARIDERTAWPRAVVVDGADRPVGILMVPAPAAYMFTRATDGRQALLELQHIGASRRYVQLLRPPVPSTTVRLRIAHDLALTSSLFERHLVVHGDFSFTNLLYSMGGHCFLLDCDGVSIAGAGGVFTGVVGTNGWADPDRPRTGPDIGSQRWQLAAAMGRIIGKLDYNPHRAKWLIRLPDDLPADRNEFAAWILAGLGARTHRPAAADWARMLATLLAR